MFIIFQLWIKKKRATKKKVSANKRAHFKTGGGPNEHQTITEMEEEILSACSGGNPTPNIPSFGSAQMSVSDEDDAEQDCEREKENHFTKANKKTFKELPARPIPKSQLIQTQINSNDVFQEKFLSLVETRNQIELEKLNLLKEERKDRLEEKKRLIEYRLLKLEAKKSSNTIRKEKLEFMRNSYN